jgi:hypothetical protein
MKLQTPTKPFKSAGVANMNTQTNSLKNQKFSVCFRVLGIAKKTPQLGVLQTYFPFSSIFFIHYRQIVNTLSWKYMIGVSFPNATWLVLYQ